MKDDKRGDKMKEPKPNKDKCPKPTDPAKDGSAEEPPPPEIDPGG